MVRCPFKTPDKLNCRERPSWPRASKRTIGKRRSRKRKRSRRSPRRRARRASEACSRASATRNSVPLGKPADRHDRRESLDWIADDARIRASDRDKSSLVSSGVEAREVAILLGIFGSAQALAVFLNGRLATRAPFGFRQPVGLELFFRSRRDLDGCAAADGEVGLLAGEKRSTVPEGRSLGICCGLSRIDGLNRIRGVPVIHRELG